MTVSVVKVTFCLRSQWANGAKTVVCLVVLKKVLEWKV